MSSPYGLEEFVCDMQRVTEAESAPAAIIDACRPLLARLLENRAWVPAEFKRRGQKGQGRYMLHRAPRFNVNVVVWGPGDGLGPHNHGTWGLIGVLENELQEKRYRRLDDGTDPAQAHLELTQTLRNRPGDISCLLPPDDIHGVLNTSGENTVDIHVYGKDLTGLPRLKFDLEKSSAVNFSSPKYDNC